MNTSSIKPWSRRIFSACLGYLVTLGSLWLFYGCASSEMVKVPASDSTPPTVLMTIFVKFTSGDSTQKIQLDGQSAAPPIMYLPDVGDGISVIASGTDRDGGIKNIGIITTISTSYTDQNGKGVNSAPAVTSIDNPSNAQVGESTSIGRSISDGYSIPDPRTHLPPGASNLGIRGEVRAHATNFHGGSAITPIFEFRYP